MAKNSINLSERIRWSAARPEQQECAEQTNCWEDFIHIVLFVFLQRKWPLVATLVLLCSLLLALPSNAQSPGSVHSDDQRIEWQLFAEDPMIVTPIGLTIDERDQLFVIESHTHLPAPDYDGPRFDRIKILSDSNGDGKADSAQVFDDQLDQAMNLVSGPDGWLYVVCAREVWRLRDVDGDGRSDQRERLLELVTKERYAHNSLLGIAISPDHQLYVSRGNTGSRAYQLRGTDGTSTSGYGDGGSVVRCDLDGSHVEEVATGFWNPFDLKFDHLGRLLLVDNDPDARGPNRLLQVVYGGDYGYRSLYGGGGNHPFQGWDGSLPGTLPFLAGTGEAPSGVIDLANSSLPADYQDCALVTIWNENSLEAFRITDSPMGLKASKSLFATGPKDFRPVAIACNSRGELFVSDWVLVDYPNHGRGRIWKVTANISAESTRPAAPSIDSLHASLKRPELSAEKIRTGLLEENPFERHAAIVALADPGHAPLRSELRQSTDPLHRLGAILAAHRGQSLATAQILDSLNDKDAQVRFAALYAAACSGDLSLRSRLDVALKEPLPAWLFNGWLAAKQQLAVSFQEQYQNQSQDKSNAIRGTISQLELWELVRSSIHPDVVRGMALREMSDEFIQKQVPELLGFLNHSSDSLRLATLERIQRSPRLLESQAIQDACVELVENAQLSTSVRCAALEALPSLAPLGWDTVTRLLHDSKKPLAIAAADALRETLSNSPSLRGQMIQLFDDSSAKGLDAEVREQLFYTIWGTTAENPAHGDRPADLAEWRQALLSGGDAFRGARVFKSSRARCNQCHTVNGVGALLGPDLSNVAASKSRAQIIDAVLEPSLDFPPQYQAWVVATVDGQIHKGLQLDHKANGAIVLTTTEGKNVRFEADEIDDYLASPRSLMPDGLQENLTAIEMLDLIAYLSSLE